MLTSPWGLTNAFHNYVRGVIPLQICHWLETRRISDICVCQRMGIRATVPTRHNDALAQRWVLLNSIHHQIPNRSCVFVALLSRDLSFWFLMWKAITCTFDFYMRSNSMTWERLNSRKILSNIWAQITKNSIRQWTWWMMISMKIMWFL